jgi:uncharacterized protein DUF1937
MNEEEELEIRTAQVAEGLEKAFNTLLRDQASVSFREKMDFSVLWYLASPYTACPLGKERAAQEAAWLAAALMQRCGINVYSPIVHGHELGKRLRELDPEREHSFWMNANKPYMHLCDGLLVAQFPGWKESKGVREEMACFTLQRKPVVKLLWRGVL